MAIFVYNRNKEKFSGDNNYRIYRPFLLGNPYSHIKGRETKAIYLVNSREESIKMYDKYFDVMYNTNLDFKDVVDEMYEKYKNGVDIYLECYCKKYSCTDTQYHDDEVLCHGDIIKSKLEKRLLKEKIKNIKNER